MFRKGECWLADRFIARSSGHRRRDAAKQAKRDRVPITLFRSTDPLGILEALIESNRQRHKTNEQIGREANVLLKIEEERAKKRRLATQNNKAGRAVKESVPERKKVKGQSRDAVGAKIGVSGKTAKQAAVAVTVMDE